MLPGTAQVTMVGREKFMMVLLPDEVATVSSSRRQREFALDTLRRRDFHVEPSARADRDAVSGIHDNGRGFRLDDRRPLDDVARLQPFGGVDIDIDPAVEIGVTPLMWHYRPRRRRSDRVLDPGNHPDGRNPAVDQNDFLVAE